MTTIPECFYLQTEKGDIVRVVSKYPYSAVEFEKIPWQKVQFFEVLTSRSAASKLAQDSSKRLGVNVSVITMNPKEAKIVGQADIPVVE